jgi:hypothetical protein
MANRFAGQLIESWNPAVDVRALELGRVFVLDGKNYRFDSKGPKSGFGNRIVSGGPLGILTDIQSVDVDKETILSSSNGIYRQEYKSPQVADALEPTTYWRKLVAFDEAENLHQFGSTRLTSAYMNGGTYVAERNHGLYRINLLDAVLHNVDGVPSNPVGIGVVGGRLLVLSASVLAFSGPGDGFDFNPAPGGAGFQKLVQYMSGDPIALTFSNKAAVAWSRESAMIAEFIGGSNVFRFDSVNMSVFPLGPMAITRDALNRTYMMTRKGLVLITDGYQIDDSIVPSFNEFFRTYLNDNHQLDVRLDYLKEEDQLYVQIADTQYQYHKTFVLSVGIDKWGSFDEIHLGVCRFGTEQGFTGFADTNGYIHKFTDTTDREIRKTGTSNLIGLDSYIDVGYLNDPQQIATADTMLEIQEIAISARMQYPPDGEMLIVDNQGDDWWDIGDGEYVDEDWQNSPEGVTINEDWNLPVSNTSDDDIIAFFTLCIVAAIDDSEEESESGDWQEPGKNEDWQLGFNDLTAEDWGDMSDDDSEDYMIPSVYAPFTGNAAEYEDWNLLLPDEDWNGVYSFLNEVNYGIEVLSSMNGYAYDLRIEPSLAREWMNRDFYTCLTAGRFHALRLSASERFEKYHLTQVDVSINYYGQTS